MVKIAMLVVSVMLIVACRSAANKDSAALIEKVMKEIKAEKTTLNKYLEVNKRLRYRMLTDYYNGSKANWDYVIANIGKAKTREEKIKIYESANLKNVEDYLLDNFEETFYRAALLARFEDLNQLSKTDRESVFQELTKQNLQFGKEIIAERNKNLAQNAKIAD
jgi:hypothetical protein